MIKTFSRKPEETKLFSPIDRHELNKTLKGLCKEYLHDIFRLILRPDHQSKGGWLKRTKGRLIDALHTKMTKTNRDLYLLYFLIGDEDGDNSDLKLNDESIENCMEEVIEENYGHYLNDDVNLCKELIQSLHDKMNPKKDYTQNEVSELVDEWYESIPKK